MASKYLNSLVYEHLLQVDKNIAEQFKKEAKVTGMLPEGSPRIIDMVRHFKNTADKDLTSKLELVDDNHTEREKSKKVEKGKSSSETIDKFSDLLSDASIEGLKPSKIPKIVKMIEDEIGIEELENISNDGFLERAENIIKNDLHNSDPYCWYCLKTFENRLNRNLHVKAIHEKKDKKYSCEICQKSFMSIVAKNYHIDVCHSDSSIELKCEVCGVVLGHSISLKRHMMKHGKDPKEYQCYECDKLFRRKDTLQKHKIMVHKLVSMKVGMAESFEESENQFECKSCGQIFSGPRGKTKLVTHLTKKCKSESERFKCDSCHTDFSRQDNLDYHRKTMHNVTNKSTFSCESCAFVTKYKTSLKRHVKRVH